MQAAVLAVPAAQICSFTSSFAAPLAAHPALQGVGKGVPGSKTLKPKEVNGNK